MKFFAVPLAVGGSFLACAAGWFALPALQGNQSSVDNQASVEVERARRLLHQYNAGLDYKSLLLAGLADAGVDVDLKTPDDLLDSVGEDFGKRLADSWKLYAPTDWGQSPRPTKAPTAGLSREIQKGVSSRKELLNDNQQHLEEAFRAVNAALGLRRGDSTAGSHAAALRLKSIILFQMARRERLHADVIRSNAADAPSKLNELAAQASASAPLLNLVAAGGVDEQIRILKGRLAEVETQAAKEKAALAQLEVRIQELTTTKDAAQRRAEEIRKTMESSRATDFSDPRTIEAFESSSIEMRESLARAQALEFGNYVNAVIGPSGDYVSGSYVPAGGSGPLTTEPGLRHFVSERVVQTARVQGAEQTRKDLRDDLAHLETLKAGQEAIQDRSKKELTALVATARDVLANWDKMDSEAEKIEDEALKLLTQAAATAKDAAEAQGRWVGEARTRTQGFSQEAGARSGVARRLQDEWLEGYTRAHQADAVAAKAWVHAIRFQSLSESAKALAQSSAALGLPEDRAANMVQRAKESQEAGIAAVNEAMAVLERVHGGVDDHWTVTAQAAGTIYLLTLLGQAEFTQQAVEAYRSAVKGREDKPFADRFTSRLKQLESRK